KGRRGEASPTNPIPACHRVNKPSALPDDLPARIRAWARELGFADAGISALELDEDLAHLQRWLNQGFHGGMEFMQRDLQLREHPAR
ncbi:UNVERIFIED_CONTAM: hypothetical protein IGO34_32325, partial [Salmonella enterica subsp. enterica serovar Weltevreden]